MRTTIDRAGRIVVPKALRDRLNLEAGAPLEIVARDGRLEIEPVAAPMRLVQRNGGLVAVADEPLARLSAQDVRAVVEAMRR